MNEPLFELDRERKRATIESIRAYFEEKLDQEIGFLGAEMLLEHVLKKVGHVIYNQAIKDAQGYLQEKVIDLGDALHAEEEQ